MFTKLSNFLMAKGQDQGSLSVLLPAFFVFKDFLFLFAVYM